MNPSFLIDVPTDIVYIYKYVCIPCIKRIDPSLCFLLPIMYGTSIYYTECYFRKSDLHSYTFQITIPQGAEGQMGVRGPHGPIGQQVKSLYLSIAIALRIIVLITSP